jgi:RecA/RadA recombinase
MKRIAALMLLVVLSFAAVIPAQAQRISPEENARQSSKAAKKQQKMLRKANRKQRKAMKKYEKTQRKATRKANRRHR